MKKNPENNNTNENNARKKPKNNLFHAKVCKSLIERCGCKFFIKYYFQIKDLPLLDIEITENYTLKEKMKRIRAVKKIISRNYSVSVAKEILTKYNKYLTESEKVKLQIIISEDF